MKTETVFSVRLDLSFKKPHSEKNHTNKLKKNVPSHPHSAITLP
jgi:hypothetical protein